MKRPSLVSQGSLTRIVQAAGEAWKRCDFPQAIELMERALRLNPSNAAILLELGRMHGVRYDYAAAETCFERVLRVSPNKAEALMAAGQHCRLFNNFSMAEGYFKRALEQKNNSPAALVALGEIYERLRRPEEAADLATRALQSDRDCAPAILLQARLDRQAGRLEAAEQRLIAFPRVADAGLRASAAYELGGIRDRQGRYDEAMTAFLEAKSFLQPHAARHIAELKVVRARIHHLISNISPAIIQEWFEAAGGLQPSHRVCLLGGHPRSGTTLLEQVLDSHPDIVSAEETDVFYNEAYGPLLRGHPDDTSMLDGLVAATHAQLQASRQNYFRATDLSLDRPVGTRLLIDKNPSYTFVVPALVRIFPEIKLIITLRDPRDIVLSCFMQNVPLNQASSSWLTLAGAAAEYADLMGVWLKLKPLLKNPWIEVRYEDMVEDLESVARPTLGFLGVSWDPGVLGFDEHARKKTVRSPTYADVAKPVYKRARGRWHHYQKYLEPHLGQLAPFVKALGYE